MTDEPELPRLFKGQLTRSEINEIADKRERKHRAKLAVENPNLAFLAREFAQCTFPHSDPKNNVWIRTNNLVTLMIEGGTNPRTGKPYGLPFGLIPRYFMVYLNTEAVKRPDRVIPLGRNLHAFMRQLGLNPESGSGKRSDYRRMIDQVTRMLTAKISFTYDGGEHERDVMPLFQMLLADEIDLWWTVKTAEADTLSESYIVLSEKAHQVMTANPVPLHLDQLAKLGRSPMAIDIYNWIGYRVFLVNNTGKPSRIPLRSLQKQFGAEYADTSQGRKDFNKYFRINFDKVAAMYTADLPLIYDYEPGVITLYPKGTELPGKAGG